MYKKYLKRVMDFVLSLIAIVVFMPIIILLAIIGLFVMRGNPFFFQLRPGKIDVNTGEENIFKLVKFRTMDERRDSKGNLLPDEIRLNAYGRWLRSTSLDELPSLWNILCGEMSIVGPRPQLVRDMVFMTDAQRRRHLVRPGLTGLAQCNGRNAISWEEKIQYDLEYLKNISFREDMKIIWLTVLKVLAREGINEEGQATAMDLGDYLLQSGKVNPIIYEQKQQIAMKIIQSLK